MHQTYLTNPVIDGTIMTTLEKITDITDSLAIAIIRTTQAAGHIHDISALWRAENQFYIGTHVMIVVPDTAKEALRGINTQLSKNECSAPDWAGSRGPWSLRDAMILMWARA
jgi:hypothetical protein